ncbi:hypothetical protein, conserved [Babesia bigemina]|uniref:C3H1-type domain-containing protein n=1 Tax=Babesia bigemina TaxID=5866 RepID=A0A061BRC5_BABBI|nr:hypothetical protein, conserved [Babesia bigemina]CDR71993.1 hypothetical protein, conserved [Babesia bigemina]|eukprot:XP_012770934.1 hypothetical protein, conserved [Babesia bigemina]
MTSLDHNNNLCLVTLHFPSSTSCHCPDHTFLGFNSASKGYDGSGIVYSDLDRLCDAVMGFLSGVLSNIKEHLGQHKDTLNDAIESLNTNKHAGKKGFNDAIVKVVEGVGRYNDGVRNSSNHVKNKITDFDREMKRLKKTVSEIVQNNRVADETLKYEQAAEEVQRRLAEYEKRAADFNKTLDMQNNDETTRNAINDLSDKLRDRIDNVRRTVVHEKTRLSELAAKEKERFQSLEACIKTTLVGVGTCVNREIGNKVNELIRGLRQMVQTIFQQLEKINKELPQHVDELQEWINNADKEIEVTQGHLKKITEQTDNSLTSLKYPIEDAVTELRKRRDELSTYIESTVKGGLTGLVTQVEEYFKVLKLNVQGEVGGSKQGLVKDWHFLSSELQTLGSGVTNTIKNGHLDKIVNGIEEYASGFNADEFGKKVEQWVSDALKNNAAVKYCMKRYISENKDRLKNGFPFNAEYVTTEKDELNYKNIQGIATRIKNKLSNQISSARAESDVVIKSKNLKKKVEYVQEVCGRFAQAIADKFNDPTNAVLKFAEEICGDIESVFCTKGRPPSYISYSDSHLKSAIRALLTALQSTVQRINDELQTFAVSLCDLGINVKGTVDKIKQIKQNISIDDNHNTSLARQITDSLSAVTGRVNDLDPILKEDGGSLKSQINDITVEITTKAITEMSTKITDTLKLLTRTISDAAFFANKKLENLKNFKVGKTPNKGELQELQHSFNDLKHPVAVALDAAKKFLGTVDHSGTATIQALGRDVDSQVESAKRTLITQARKQYVTSLQGLLVAFSTKAETELQPLPGLITKESESGFKGFMSIMDTQFLKHEKGLQALKKIPDKASPGQKSPLSQASTKLYGALKRLFHYLAKQPDLTYNFGKANPSHDALRMLLTAIEDSQRYDRTFMDYLNRLRKALGGLTSDKLCESSALILDALRLGFMGLVGELDKTYINMYEGAKPIKHWVIELPDSEKSKTTTTVDTLKDKASSESAKQKDVELTLDGKRGAMVCLSMIPIVYTALDHLKSGLDAEGWESYKMYDSTNPNHSLHKTFFHDQGYDIGAQPTIPYGELNHRQDFNGSSILKHLTNAEHKLFVAGEPADASLLRTDGSADLTVEVATDDGVVQKLYSSLHDYFTVCHLTRIEKPRAPCSVYEILVWCCGLQFNPVYERFKKHVESEFMKEDKQRPGTKTLQPFEAHPSPVKYTDVEKQLYNVSAHSHAVLTAILGHGHKDGIYACEFSDNSLKLDYPTSMIQLLCTLFDLLKRLYHQLYFLLQQCQLTTQLSGWRDCHYGRYIGGSGWQCNTKQCPKQDCDQRHDQSGNQTGGQYPNCGVKSPLQSFLEDGLKGHLPHSVTARGSSLSCGTCGSTPGMPCRTPMGFADIGATASHTMMGRNICEVLYDFCGRPNSPLTRLCGYLNCLLPSAPKTLTDMFSFYYHLTDRWGMHGNKHKKEAFEEKVKAANFGRSYGELNVYHLFTPSHSALKKGHSDGSLGSLVCLSRDAVVCGPYLRPITHAIYETFSSKHADKYLSWIVYLTASFYDLLKKLYDECNSKCGARGSNCHGKSCIKGCPTTSKKDPPRYHDRNCKSIVQCNATLPTLAKYGFVLGDPERLNGSAGIEKKRTCRDFCYVFAEAFEKDSHLVQFFKAIDKFMFTIRAPFLWMNVALWSLSLFYLICVMVGRLDVLHIRSHLRTPSSHRITAQSLLAAAQVGRLAKISYLQP